MRAMYAALFATALASSASSDEIVLKNGKHIEFRVLKDGGDSIDVQTTENQTLTFKKDDVKEVKLSVPKAPLTGASFVGDEAKSADRPVNLLAGVDPKKHGLLGEWYWSAGALMGRGIGIIEIPYIPATKNYDVDLALERKDGEDEISVGLVFGGQPFSVVFDWGRGECTGLTCVNGNPVYQNESKVVGKQILPKKPSTLKCAVREGRVVIILNGKTLIDWKGDVGTLSHPGRTKEQNLFFAIRNSTVSVSRFTFTGKR